MKQESNATKLAKEQQDELVNAILELRRLKSWAVFREHVERRIDVYMVDVIKPVNSSAGAFDSERAKGSVLGLQALLFLFDSNLPQTETTDHDAQ